MMKPKRPLFGLADEELFDKHWMRTPWKRNVEQTHCYSCSNPFGSIVRYHHCRSCGNCICANCSVFRYLLAYGYGKTRICVNCDQNSNIFHIVHGKFSRDIEAFKHQVTCVRSIPVGQFHLETFEVRSTDYAVIHHGTNTATAHNNSNINSDVDRSDRKGRIDANQGTSEQQRQVQLLNLKCFRKSVATSQDFNIMYREANCLRAMSHPHIVPLISSNIGTQDRTVPAFPYIITPRSPLGTLNEFCEARFYSSKEKRVVDRSIQDWHLLLEMLLQIVRVLKYLKDEHKIMHNDVRLCHVHVMCDRLHRGDNIENPLLRKNSPLSQSTTKKVNPSDEFKIRTFSSGDPSIPSTRLSTVVEERCESLSDRSFASSVAMTPDYSALGKASFAAPAGTLSSSFATAETKDSSGAGDSGKYSNLYSCYNNSSSSDSTFEASSFSPMPVLIKLSDFSNLRSSALRTYHIGPQSTHRAPEVWRNEPYDFKADCFSFGQLVAELILVLKSDFMTNYFEDDTGALIQRAICNGIMPPIGREKSKVGQELGELVKECWKSRTKRPNFETLDSVLMSIIRVYCTDEQNQSQRKSQRQSPSARSDLGSSGAVDAAAVAGIRTSASTSSNAGISAKSSNSASSGDTGGAGTAKRKEVR